MAEKLTVFDPTTRAEGQTITFAPRPKLVRNLCIGLVDNTKFNSDKLLLRIASILQEEHGIRRYFIRRKRNSSVPVDEEAVKEYISNCDVVIAGIGDWGSCSAGSVLDGILFEKHGVPAVSIITEGFVETARAMARSWGLPDYKFLTIPHPISNLTSEELDRRARGVTPRIVDFLLKGQE